MAAVVCIFSYLVLLQDKISSHSLVFLKINNEIQDVSINIKNEQRKILSTKALTQQIKLQVNSKNSSNITIEENLGELNLKIENQNESSEKLIKGIEKVNKRITAFEAEITLKKHSSKFNMAILFEEKANLAFLKATTLEFNSEEQIKHLRYALLYALEAQAIYLSLEEFPINSGTMNQFSILDANWLIGKRKQALIPNPDLNIDNLIDSKVLLFKMQNHYKEEIRDGVPYSVQAVGYSPDGKTIATVSRDSNILISNTKQSEDIQSLQGHRGQISTLSYSHNGEVIATSSKDRTVRFWDVSAGKTKFIINVSSSVYTLAFSPESQILATGSLDGIIRLWDAKTGSLLSSFGDNVFSISALDYSPDGKVIAAASDDGTVRLWSAQTGVLLKAFQPHQFIVSQLSYSPSGEILATASWDKTVRISDANTGELLRTLRGHSDVVTTLGFSPDGNTIATSGRDKTVRIWNVDDGSTTYILKGHNNTVLSLAYSPDGTRILTGSDSGELRIWNPHSDQSMQRLIYEFDPRKVVDALKYLWGLNLDGINFYTQTLKQNQKYRALLKKADKKYTVVDQLIYWLEDQKAFRKTSLE